MKQAEIYNGHAGHFHRMAEHIEHSMTQQYQQEHGATVQITTNDITLATTLMNAVYGYPAGKRAVLGLSAGMIPGEERSQTVRGLFMMTAGCSEYDQTVTYTIIPLPGQEMETARLFKATAVYSLERAEAHYRTIPLLPRQPDQLER
jgi:hypothetical protein